MEKPKVILIGTAWPFRGGLAAYNERLAREYQELGYHVRIVTFTTQYPGFLFPGKTQMADWDAPEGLKISREISSINPFSWFRTARKIRKEQPDLLLFKYWLPFMGPCFGTIARRVKKNRHTRVITILDNIIPHEHRPGDRLFTQYFIKPVDGLVAMSDAVLEDTKKFDTKKPRAFCPHPLFDNFGQKVRKEEARQHLGLDPHTPLLLFFGFIRSYKGLDLLLDALADESLRKLPFKLVVAGEFYSDSAPYLSQISNLHLEERVILKTDFIPDHEVKYYFSACDLVIQPYKTATQSGISQIAYHFEKPMIVTRVGGLPEIVPDGKVGYVVDKAPSAIAAAILKFYREGKEEAFASAAAREKEKYSWKRMVDTITEITEKL